MTGSQAKVVSGPQADSDVAVKVIELEESLGLRPEIFSDIFWDLTTEQNGNFNQQNSGVV